jgi:hypothetical protein
MYSNSVEAEYYEKRLKRSLEMAAMSASAEAGLAHHGLAACYRAKLMSLVRAEAPSRAILSLGALSAKVI